MILILLLSASAKIMQMCELGVNKIIAADVSSINQLQINDEALV